MSRLRHCWPKTTRRLAAIAGIELLLGILYVSTQVLH